MNKDELKKEAEENCVCTDKYMRKMFEIGYIAGAEPREKRIAELEARCNELFLQTCEQVEKIADLKCECRRCVYTDCPCILSDYGKDRNGICDHFKDVFDENAELKDYRLTTLAKQQTDLSKYALNLENKLNWYDDRLTQAKEIIKDFLLMAKVEHLKERYESIDEAEQFLSEVEK